jgi:hypothetical protein
LEELSDKILEYLIIGSALSAVVISNWLISLSLFVDRFSGFAYNESMQRK